MDSQGLCQSRSLFVKMIGTVDIKERLKAEKLMEDLKDKLRAKRKDPDMEIVVQLTH
jgi:hypothetical protein